jgi:hypothetical protein
MKLTENMKSARMETGDGFHDAQLRGQVNTADTGHLDTQFIYTFKNFFHPFVGELIAKLNKDSLSEILDPKWQDSLRLNNNLVGQNVPADSFDTLWEHSQIPGASPSNYFRDIYNPSRDNLQDASYSPKEIEVSPDGSYSNYNWELFFHIPLTIAVHLSKNQRFAEAQRWFHYVFNPTSNDHSVDTPRRFWNFLAFRNPDDKRTVDQILRLLSMPADSGNSEQKTLLENYRAILDKPFQPHAVARTRHLAYEYCVVMKYLDNLIAWGDSLFLQDTIESINEATQIYVLAANILGQRPQQIPPMGKVKPKTFARLKSEGLGPVGDALQELEGLLPFNLALPAAGGSASGADAANPLFGIGRTLYFCVPRNPKMLSYWDAVADRLFKIRHCMNMAGVVRQLALFDPPLDPGMLVRAAAVGIDVGSIVSGLNQPAGPVRSLFLIQKALELCGEVRSLGGALLSALEKGDAEHLARVRQSHEIQIQQMTQEVRFLQLQQAKEATTSLLTSRATALERLHYYQRLLGLAPDSNAQTWANVDPVELTEDNFEQVYQDLVGQYTKELTMQELSPPMLAGETSPDMLAGYSGGGNVYLSKNENVELNTHLPAARDLRLVANVANLVSAALMPIPSVNVDGQFWGIGAHSRLFDGKVLGAIVKTSADVANTFAAWEQDQAGMASRYASYERRANDWQLQYNLAAHEVMQNGRQILSSLIAEQVAHHEYLNIQRQIANAQEIDQFLQEKFTNEDLYLWMQGEISRLYYEYYRFAFDTARRAERTMKQELMRPELDAQDFVKFNYWDGGRKGLLSGEALHLDVKRMEMAYHDNNKRELELTKHVSLRQLDPLALLTLRATGSCQLTIPEWVYDLDCPGHYMRRIKTVALSIPSVVGPYTGVHCTLSLLRSSVRTSPTGNYPRQVPDDDRFVDYTGAIQSVVTSTGQSDSGIFETNLRDERLLPFENAGAESTWRLQLPKDYRAFDYSTISDVILHVRYTARQGVPDDDVRQALDALFSDATRTTFALVFSLRHDFPTEWAAFVQGNASSAFTATIRREHFPYFTQGKKIGVTGFELYDQDLANHHAVGRSVTPPAAFPFTVSVPPDDTTTQPQILTRTANDVFLLVRYIVGG